MNTVWLTPRPRTVTQLIRLAEPASSIGSASAGGLDPLLGQQHAEERRQQTWGVRQVENIDDCPIAPDHSAPLPLGPRNGEHVVPLFGPIAVPQDRRRLQFVHVADDAFDQIVVEHGCARASGRARDSRAGRGLNARCACGKKKAARDSESKSGGDPSSHRPAAASNVAQGIGRPWDGTRRATSSLSFRTALKKLR